MLNRKKEKEDLKKEKDLQDREKNEILGNADLLRSCNLKPPDIVTLFWRLKTEGGLPIEKIPLTVEDAVKVIETLNIKPFKIKRRGK